ncbi:response regulator transcription factor [Harryflintia acetispora]|uniref:response regulator transcription factor n=1 Tax=Harryflintia acetispora TaxID=1849041 RepID=UPI00189AE3E8|nr:response regulator [Harryflintia acetispora]
MYSLMIVDDEYEIHNGISRYFPWEELGFTVVAHLDNGKKAYEYLQRHPVDVVLCDINMPVMNGLELARLIHENHPHIQTVFLSGYSDFAFAQQALEYHVKSYILKSSKYNELIRVFTKLKSELDSAHSGEKALEDNDSRLPTFDEKVMDTIKKYIDEHYMDVTLEDLTGQVHMNPQYISKYFKKMTGRNFSDYLIEVRMKKAAELLQDIRYKTYEVSALVGYSNSVNFTRTFKHYYGMTPREYRGRHRNTSGEGEGSP